jgi:hypothetical protein
VAEHAIPGDHRPPSLIGVLMAGVAALGCGAAITGFLIADLSPLLALAVSVVCVGLAAGVALPLGLGVARQVDRTASAVERAGHAMTQFSATSRPTVDEVQYMQAALQRAIDDLAPLAHRHTRARAARQDLMARAALMTQLAASSPPDPRHSPQASHSASTASDDQAIEDGRTSHETSRVQLRDNIARLIC